jgi:UDP-glucose 4,6-dehydratase
VAVLVKHELKLDKSFSFFKSAEDFYGEAASTPRSNCVMDNSKLLSTGFRMRPATEAIIASLKEWKKE